MKSIIFKKIKIKNFLSIGNDWVEIDYKSGINVVTGINYDKDSRNGIGKSALLADSLSFALFGVPCRDIKKEFIGNRFTKKGTKVILSFDVIADGVTSQYVLMRSINPNKVQLIKDGTDNITKSSMPKTTDFVSKLIGATPEVFVNTVVMTLNETIPFMAQKKVDKRKFIEGVLKLEVFSNMLLTARQDYNNFKQEHDTEFTRLEEIRKFLETYINQQASFDINKQKRSKELLRRKASNEKEIELQKEKLDETKVDLAVINNNITLLENKELQCANNINDLYQIIGTYEADIKNLETQLLELITRGEICTKCKRIYTEKDKTEAQEEKAALEQHKTQLEQNLLAEKGKLTSFCEMKEKCQAGIQKLRTQIAENNIRVHKNENLLSRIEQLNSWNKQINRDIEKIEQEEDHFSNIIDETRSREKVLLEKCNEIKKKLQTIEAVKFVVSEEGVKSFIVKKILKVLNTKLRYYLQKFDSNCTLTFNEYFEEQLIDDKGEETTYNNCSSGEKRRIDLACIFTFMDIRRLQGDVSTNVSVYDELFDSALETKGVNMALEILKERVDKYNEAIYIVSHRPEAVKSATGEVIFLEKRNGITKKLNEIPEEIFTE